MRSAFLLLGGTRLIAGEFLGANVVTIYFSFVECFLHCSDHLRRTCQVVDGEGEIANGSLKHSLVDEARLSGPSLRRVLHLVFFDDEAAAEIYTLPLRDALPRWLDG